jgi:hypothetical protein
MLASIRTKRFCLRLRSPYSIRIDNDDRHDIIQCYYILGNKPVRPSETDRDIMNDSPITFPWMVDEAGYKIAAGALMRRGGPFRYYYPLEDETLWLRFAQTCVDPESVLTFAQEFGTLSGSSNDADNRLEDVLAIAAKLREIMRLLETNKRHEATLLFHKDGHAPRMREIIAWFSDNNTRFIFLPQTLQDAFFHQAGEAITGNRRFRRCRNEGCSNWFRLGPHAGSGRRGSTTITARREFCSDRCRVASARRQKREVSQHA